MYIEWDIMVLFACYRWKCFKKCCYSLPAISNSAKTSENYRGLWHILLWRLEQFGKFRL